MLRFVHISDSHLGPDRTFELFGRRPAPALELMVQHVNALKFDFDFIIHTGDVTAHPDAASYDLALEILRKFKKPLYVIPGNHDSSAGIRRMLSGLPHVEYFPTSELISYQFSHKGFRFLCLDMRADFKESAYGQCSDELIDLLRSELSHTSVPTVIFMHYPLIPLDSNWLRREMLVSNGNVVHEIFAKAGNCIQGVFLGHVHCNIQAIFDGIHYTSVPSTFCSFTTWAPDEHHLIDEHQGPSFNVVTLTNGGTIVKSQVVALER